MKGVIRTVVVNRKGGCGKTTVTTNLASFYADSGYKTAIYDYDHQGCSLRWLEHRPDDFAPLIGINAYETAPSNVTRSWKLRVPEGIQRIIVDMPAGVKVHELMNQLNNADNVIVPVLPSQIDMLSTADFIRDLMLIGQLRKHSLRIGIVANRLKKNTKSLYKLKEFLNTLNIPLVSEVRDTQGYISAVEHGAGIHEMPRCEMRDMEPWMNLINWIEAPLSQAKRA